jgi:hypothetical protein
MKEFVGENPADKDARSLRVFFSLFKATTNIIQDAEELSEKMKEYNDILCESCNKLVVDLKASFNNGDKETALVLCTSVLEWASLCRETMTKICKNNKSFEHIDYYTSEKFLRVAYDVLFVGFPDEALFFNSGDDQLNTLIYSAKENILKVVSNLIIYIKPHLHMQQLKDTSFIKLITTITPQLLSGLIELGISTELEDSLQNAKLLQFTTLMLTVCSQLVYVKDLHECYSSYGVRLFTDIGFSFLRTMKTEKEEMVDNPSEFIKLALDV